MEVTCWSLLPSVIVSRISLKDPGFGRRWWPLLALPSTGLIREPSSDLRSPQEFHHSTPLLSDPASKPFLRVIQVEYMRAHHPQLFLLHIEQPKPRCRLEW
jgi:hypothetical protein